MNKSFDPEGPHSHDPNPEPPSDDPTFTVSMPEGRQVMISTERMAKLPRSDIKNCYIVSTGHGTSGPFSFSGVAVIDLITAFLSVEIDWDSVVINSGDGFGTRISKAELDGDEAYPIILADMIDGRAMTRAEGLVRLIAPEETNDALRQVKWISRVVVD